jgi:hypothetical protein
MNIGKRVLAVAYDLGNVSLWRYVNSVFMNFANVENSTKT